MLLLLGCFETQATEAPLLAEAPASAQTTSLPPTCPATLSLKPTPKTAILISKAEHLLGFYKNGSLATHQDLPACFPMSLGFTPTGPKRQEGDGKTPEGLYQVFHKNPNSSFHVSLGVSYPNPTDAKAGLESEIIDQATYQRIIKNPAHPPQTTAMGGLIYIHGGGVGSDWTWGCIAVENTVMDYLFAESSVGTTIAIVPSLQAMAF